MVDQPQDYGTLFVFYAVVGRRLLSCFGSLVQNKSAIENYKVSLDVIMKELAFNDTLSLTTDKPSVPLIDSFEVLSFSEISFGYKTIKPVLHSVSFDIKRNQSIAFVDDYFFACTKQANIKGRHIKRAVNYFSTNN